MGHSGPNSHDNDEAIRRDAPVSTFLILCRGENPLFYPFDRNYTYYRCAKFLKTVKFAHLRLSRCQVVALLELFARFTALFL